MKTLYILLFATAVLMPLHAVAQDRPPNQGWSYSIGAGVVAVPSYLGDDDYQLLALPNFRVTYSEKFFASFLEGVGYNVIKNDNWRIGLIGKLDIGREEDGSKLFLVSGDKTDDLEGLGDVDGTVELGGFAEYTYHPITAKVEVRQGVGGHEGLVGEVKVEYKGRSNIFRKPVFYSIGPEIKYADASYNEAYFGVNATQSAASGLSRYTANAGLLSYGVSGSVVVALTERISTLFFAGCSRLGKEAADASLVQERGSDNQASVGLFINYTFSNQ
jgi:MipA family protein